MADRHGEGVGGVALGAVFKVEQDLDHVLDLQLVGVAAADDGLLDLRRRELEHGQAAAGAGDDGSAARLAQLERRIDVAVDEHLFDRHLHRLVALDDGLHFVEDDPQPLRHLPLRRAYAAVGDMGSAAAIHVDDTEAGDPRSRIDPKDARHRVQVRLMPTTGRASLR